MYTVINVKVVNPISETPEETNVYLPDSCKEQFSILEYFHTLQDNGWKVIRIALTEKESIDSVLLVYRGF